MRTVLTACERTPGYGHPGYGHPGYGHPGYGHPGYGHPGYGVIKKCVDLALKLFPIMTPLKYFLSLC